MSNRIETRHIVKPWEADRRLEELGLNREGLVRAASRAMAARQETTKNHPANTAGTRAYQEGIRTIRNQFLGKEWEIDRKEGVECMRNGKRRIRVAYCNVDRACDLNYLPSPRSAKGEGTERISGASPMLVEAPLVAPAVEGEKPAFYYLMVDDGGQAELSRPVIVGGAFAAAVERIFLIQEAEKEDGLPLWDAEEAADGTEPQIDERRGYG